MAYNISTNNTSLWYNTSATLLFSGLPRAYKKHNRKQCSTKHTAILAETTYNHIPVTNKYSLQKSNSHGWLRG